MKLNQRVINKWNKFSNILCVLLFFVYMLRMNLELIKPLTFSYTFRILVFLSIPCVIVRFIRNKPNKEIIYLSIFFLFNILSTFMNQNTFSRVSVTMLIDLYVCFYVFYYLASTKKDSHVYNWIVNSFLIITSVMAILALLIYITNISYVMPNGYIVHQIYDYDNNRNPICNILVNSNQGAINSLICTIICLMNLYQHKWEKKQLLTYIPLLILHIIIIILADSETVIAILGLFAFLYLFHIINTSQYQYKEKLKTVIWISIAVLVTVVFAKKIPAFNRIYNATKNGDLFHTLDQLTSGRMLTWKAVFVFNQGTHIFYGNGILSLKQLALTSAVYQKTFYYENAHNLFLDIYFRTGIIGLILNGFFITALIKIVWPVRKQLCNSINYYRILICLGVFLFSLNDCAVLYLSKNYNVIFWYFLGCIVFDASKIKETGQILDLKADLRIGNPSQSQIKSVFRLTSKSSEKL